MTVRSLENNDDLVINGDSNAASVEKYIEM